MGKVEWFRLSSDDIKDQRLETIAETVNIPRCYVLGCWVALLCIANDSPERGKLLINRDLPINARDIAHELDETEVFVEFIIGEFLRAGMLTLEDGALSIVEWEKYKPGYVRGDWDQYRDSVFFRDGYACAYCGKPAEQLDHIVPRAKGGPDEMTNLVAACESCNRSKRDNDVFEWYAKQCFFDPAQLSYVLSILTNEIEVSNAK